MDRRLGLNVNSVFRRTVCVAALLGFVSFVILIIALFNIQIVKSDEYQSKAVTQQTRNEIINPARGTIYDKNMNAMAVSTTTETVCISPHDIKDEKRELIVSGLVAILGVDRETVYQKTLNKKSYYTYIKKQVSEEVADKVRVFITDNKLSQQIFLVEDTIRSYPYGLLGAQILGFTGTDGDGLSGIEYSYNSVLKGTPGRIVAAKNAKGSDMPSDYETYYDAQDGDTLVLTLDAVIQGYLESALQTARENASAASASGIVMDVNTAKILAMGTCPGYDPNDPFTILDGNVVEQLSLLPEEEQKDAKYAALSKLWTDDIISTTYEPGSVFKIITAAMALEESVTTLYDDSFTCNGSKSITIYDYKIGCWKDGGHGHEDFLHGVMNSCNPVFIEVGSRLGGNTFFKYFEAFGFTQKTGISLPGEAGGSAALYHDAAYLSSVPISLATSTFGQTFTVTPLQLITAVSAAVNGGTLYEPLIIDKEIDKNGVVQKEYDSVTVRQVITEQTSKDLCFALEQVVSAGTGSNAYVKGYSVGGKTGTTVITSTNNTDNKKYISSFLAFAPSDDPQIAVLILVNEPTSASHSGNMLAAPYAAQIIEKSLKYMGVEPEYTADEYATLDVTIPDFTDMTKSELQEYCSKYDLSYSIEGEGEYVTDQMPVAGAVVPRSAELVIYMGGSKPSGTVGIPNVVGMTLSGIQRFLANSNIYIRAVGNTATSGNKLSVSQDPPAGDYVEAGTVLTVNFVNDTSNENIE